MLSNASLVGVKLSGSKLNGAYLDGATLIGVDISDAQLRGVLLGRTIFHLASVQYISSSSPDNVSVGIAKPSWDESIAETDDQISSDFMWASVAPVFVELNSENLDEVIDSESRRKFRRSAIASLTPTGII